MKSKVDVAEAKRLRDEGWTLVALGERYGVTRERVRQLVGPAGWNRTCEWCGVGYRARNANSRCCSHACGSKLSDERARKPCANCGTSVTRYSELCVDCRIDKYDRDRNVLFSKIQELWLEGLPAVEIAERVGMKNANCLNVRIAHMKAAGWDIPNRRPGWKGPTNQTGPPLVLPRTKQQVNQRLTYAIRMGKVERGTTCERCGAEGRCDGHHHDYTKPLDVEWLCRSCHRAHHAAERSQRQEAA